MNPDLLLVVSILFFIIAILYSAAGFGGGSSYLAILALLNVAFLPMKTIALLCNILVVTGNLIVFNRKYLLDLKNSLPLIIISVPASFLGGIYPLEPSFFYILLGLTLILAGTLLLLSIKKQFNSNRRSKNSVAMASSAGIGLISGLVGIGGGIFLSPVLNLIGWNDSKKIAATASLFILANSISAISGHFIRYSPSFDQLFIIPLMAAVIIGGQIGSRLTAYRLQQKHIKGITAVLIIAAGVKILCDHLLKAH